MTLDQLTTCIEEVGGIATAAELKGRGFSPGLIAYACRKGRIEKLTRGVYGSPDVFEDDFAAINARWRKCVFSHASALYLDGLSDRLPATIDVTVPHGYNAACLKTEFPHVRIHRVAGELHVLGLAEVTSPAGNVVRCYDAERSLADLLRERKHEGVDAQLVRDAVVGYFKRRDRDLPKLASMCEARGVRDELQVYLEVL